IKAFANLTVCLRGVPDDEPCHAESIRLPLNLRSAFGVHPLRISTKPEGAIFIDAQPTGIAKECLEGLGILTLRFIQSIPGGSGQFFEGAARLGELFVDEELSVGIERFDFGSNGIVELLDAVGGNFGTEAPVQEYRIIDTSNRR